MESTYGEMWSSKAGQCFHTMWFLLLGLATEQNTTLTQIRRPAQSLDLERSGK